MFPDHDAGLGEAAAGRAGEDLEEMFAEPHRVVIGDDALVGEAADVVEDLLGRQWAIRGVRIRRSAGKARIVARKESRQDGVGVLERSGPRTAEFADEAILEGAPQALDAAFGLGRGGRDPADAEVRQGTAKLGRGTSEAAQLLGETGGSAREVL
jgi:hypothetical protein